MPDEPLEIRAHESPVNAVAFSPDGTFLVSAGSDHVVKLWRPGEWELFSTFFGHTAAVRFLSFGPEGEVLATSSTDRTVRLWSFPFGAEERVETGLRSALISPDGTLVASLDREDRVRLWSPETGETGGHLEHAGPVTAVAFEPGGAHLVAASEGSGLVRWRIGDGEVVDRIEGDGRAVAALCFFDGGRRIVASGPGGRVRIYDTATWDESVRIDLDADGTPPLGVDPEGEELAVGTPRRIRTFATRDGAPRLDLELPGEGVHSLTYSPDGEWLSAAGADERIRIWTRS